MNQGVICHTLVAATAGILASLNKRVPDVYQKKLRLVLSFLEKDPIIS